MSTKTPNQKDLESIKAIHNQLETLEGNFQSATNSTRSTLQQHQKQIQDLKQALDNLNSKQSKLSNSNSEPTSNNQQISLLQLNEKVNQLLQNQNKILSIEKSIKTLSTEISILKKQKNITANDTQIPSEIEPQDIEQIKNELDELKEQISIRPTLRLVERSIQNELERQQNISSFEKENQSASEISSIKHEIQLLKQQIQSDKSISQINELKNNAKELKEKLQSKDPKKSTHPDEFCQQMRNELTFLEENFIEAYNFNTISLASQAKQIKQLRHIILSPYDYDESEENSSNENSEDENDNNNSKRRIPDSNTKKLKNIIQNLQESVKKQTEADHAVLRCLKYEIKKLKSQEALVSIENSIENLRNQISNVEEKENEKIEALQDKIENAQNRLKKLRLFNGKDDAEDGNLDNSTFFDGSVDSLRAHLAKLDAEVKEFRLQLQKSKTDSEDIEKSITNIVNCLKHEMKKVKNNQSALTNHLKEKGLLTSDLELEGSSNASLSDDSIEVKSRNVNLPFEKVTSEKVPDGYYKISLPDEPFDEIKKELYTLECNFIQTANVHATSIEDHYRQLEEIRKNLQQKKNIEPDSNESSENKSEIIKSLKLEVQKLKQNGILTDQQMRGIEDMNNRIAAIEDYLQDEPEIVEIHPLDEDGNSIQESNSTNESLFRPIVDTINAMAEEIRMIKDNYDVRDTVRCIKHELKKQSVDANQYKRSLMEKNQYQIKEINLRLDTIEDYLVNETEEEEVKEDNKLNTLNDVISSMANSMSSMKSEMSKLKHVISVQNQELIPIKERLDAMEQERRKSSIQSKKDIEKLKKALDSIEPKTPQETLDAIENIMKQIEETMNKQDADRNTIRCLKHEMVKLKGPLEKAGQHTEEIEQINNRLNTIEEYLQEDEPIVDIENAEEEEEEYEEDPTIQIGNVVASLIESMKSIKDELDQLREDTYAKDNDAIRCVKHELKKLKCQIELQELLNLSESENAQLPDDYEEQIKRLKKELRTLEDNFVDTTNSQQGSISVNSLEIEKLKKRYAEFQELEKQLENDRGLTLKERLENLEHSNRCLKYEMKKLMYENEIKNILQEEMMSSSMNLSTEEADSLNLSPESEAKISHIKEELRKLEKNFEETSTLHTNSLDIHEMQLMKLKKLIAETDEKIGGKSLEDIEDKLNRQVSNLENLFTERLRKTNLNVHVIEKQIENLYTNHGMIPFYPTSFESVFDDENKEIDTRGGYVKVTPSKVGGNQFLFIDKNLDVLFKAVNELRKAHIEGLSEEEGINLIPDSEKLTISEILPMIQNLDRKNKRLEKTINDLSEEFKKIAANQDTQVLNLGAYYEDEENDSLNEEDSKKSNVDGEQLNQLQNEIAELRQIIQNKDSAENSVQIGNLLSLQDFSNGEDEEGFKEITDEIKNNVSNMKNDVDNQIEELKNKIASLSQQIVESTEPPVEREVRLEINKDDWSSNSMNESSEDFEIIKRDNQEIKENIDTLNQQIEIIKDAIAQHTKRIQKNEEGVTLRLDLLNQSEINNDEQQQDIEDIQSDVQEMKDSIFQLTNVLNCIKHELKKLKSEFVETKNRNADFSEVIRLDDPKSEFIYDLDDLKEDLDKRIKKQEEDLDSLKSEIKQLKDSNSKKNLNEPSGMVFSLTEGVSPEEINDLDEKVEIISESTNEMKHSIRCLKYEIKRLKDELERVKENQNQPVTERRTNYNLADENSSDNNDKNNDDLEKEIEEIVTIANEKIEDDVKLIKNELDEIRNRLKEMKENEDKRIRDLNTFKLNETQNSSLIEEEEERKENDDDENLKHSLRCIKYEIKKLKNKFNNLDDKLNQIDADDKSSFILNEGSSLVSSTNDKLKDDLMKIVSNSSDDLNNKINNLNDDLDKLRNEIQDIKDSQNDSNHENSIFDINKNDNNYDEIEELREKTREISESTDELKRSVGCLKFEVKRLKSKSNDQKEDPIAERDIFNINSENFNNNTFDNDEFRDEIKQFVSDSNDEIARTIRCLKHEIKGLKGKLETIQQEQIKPEDEYNIKDVSSFIQPERDDSLGCLKYEVKRLKNTVSQLNDDMKDLKNQKQMPKSEHNTFILRSDDDDDQENYDRSLGCIKYEIKRLKEKVNKLYSNNEPEFDERQANVNHQNYDPKSIDEISNDIRCLKFEIKRLKDRVNNMNPNDDLTERKANTDKQNYDPKSNDEISNDVRCLKYEFKRLKERVNSLSPNDEYQRNDDLKSIGEITNDIRCLKFEIKRLKSKSNAIDRSFIIEPSMNYGDENQPVQAINEEEIKRIIHDESSQMDYSIKCMKYEIKRLKEGIKDLRNKQDEEDVYNLRNQEIINDEIKDEINSLKSLTTKFKEDSSYSIGCLKYEVKRLKSLTSQLKEKQDEMDRDTFILESESHKEFEHEISEIQEDLKENKIKSIELQDDLNNLKEEVQKLKDNNNQAQEFNLLDDENNDRSLKCIKYEIKRLKETISVLSENMDEIKGNQKQTKSISERNTFILDEPSQNDEINQSIGCLKYEVKKLKEMFNEISNNDIQETILKATDPINQSIGSLKFEIKKLKQSINNNNNNDIQESILNTTNPINHSVRCMKYEIKKLKETMEKANHNIAKLKYFYKQLASNKSPDSPLPSPMKQDDDKLQQTIKSIKFEIRRLKDNYKDLTEKVEQNSVVQLQPENDDDEKLRQTVKALKFEVKRLKANFKELADKQKESLIPRECEVQLAQSDNFNNDEIEELKRQISASNKDFEHTIRCMKYEIKQLKFKQPQQIPVQKQNQNEQQEQFSLEVDLNDINSDAEIIISPSATVQEIQTSIRCMKYEIKKLKEKVNDLTSNQEREVVMIQDNLSQTLDASEVEKMISDSNIRNLKPIKNDINNIKEVFNKLNNKIKKLESKQPQNNLLIVPDDDDSVDKSQIDKINYSLKCLKYEVKKIKENANEMKAQQEINHSLKCLKYEVKKIKENINEMKTQQENFVKKNASFVFDLDPDQDNSNQNEMNEFKQTLNMLKSRINKLEQGKNDGQNEFYTLNGYDDSEIQELKQIVNEARDEFNHSLKCIKYEVKKIKDNKQIGSVDSPDLTKVHYDISCLKYEIKKLKQKQPTAPISPPKHREVPLPSNIPEDIRNELYSLRQDFDQFENDVNSIKHDIKKLKLNQKSAPDSAQTERPAPTDYQDLDNIQHDINCIKYEIKKLKLKLDTTPIPESTEKSAPAPTTSTTIPDDLLARLSAVEKECKETKETHKQDFDNIQHDFNCIKYEVKKLKLKPEITVAPAASAIIPGDLNDLISEIQDELRCVKYELKKLKQQPTPIITTPAPPTTTIPNDLLERLKEVERISQEAKDKSDTAIQTANESQQNSKTALDTTEKLRQDFDKIQHDVNCIKYEIKKLKLKPDTPPATIPTPISEPTELTEKSVPAPTTSTTIPNDLLSRLSAVEKECKETKETHQQDFDNIKHDFNCIKYEIKKLKLKPDTTTTPITEPTPESTMPSSLSSSIPNELLDRLNKIENLAKTANDKIDVVTSTTEKLEQTSNESKATANEAKVAADSIQQNMTKLQYDLGCIKFEIKRLKQQSTKVQPIQQQEDESTPTFSGEYDTRLSVVEQNASEAAKIANKANDEIELIKDGINKLKETLSSTQHDSSVTQNIIPEDLLARLSAIENECKETKETHKQDFDNIQHDFNCIKYEVKKLKLKPDTPTTISPISKPTERSAPEPTTTTIPNDLLERLKEVERISQEAKDKSDTAIQTANESQQNSKTALDTTEKLRQDFDKIQHDVNCIKYEIKKLKLKPDTTPTPESTMPSSSSSSSSIPNELLDRLNKIENLAKTANDKIEKLEQTSNDEIELIKDEINKLKETLSSTQHDSSVAQNIIPDDLLSRLAEAENAYNETKQQIAALHLDREREKEDLKCIKYELKKLKEGNQTSE